MQKTSGASTKNVLWTIIVTLFLLLFIVPYLYLAFFGTIAQDDFSMLLTISRLPVDTFLERVYYFAVNFYIDWQGTFFSNILFSVFLIPFHRFGNFIIQTEMFLGITFYLLSMFYMFYKLVSKITDNYVNRNVITGMIVGTCFVTIIFHSICVKDVFYWISGMVVYLIPLALAFLSLAILLDDNSNKFKYVLGALMAFLSSGGSTNVAAFTCFSTLMLTVLDTLRKKKFGWNGIFFLAAFIGAIINVMAPGNYVRYNGTPNTDNAVIALKLSVQAVIARYKWPYVMVFSFICITVIMIFIQNDDDIINKLKRIKFINPILLAIILFWGEVIIDFPVFLGATFLSERNIFMAKNALSIFTILFLADTIGYLNNRFDLSRMINKKTLAIVLVMCITSAILIISLDDKTKEYPYVIVNDIFQGKQFDYVRANNYVLDTIKNSNGGDLVIEVDNYPIIDYMKGMGVKEETDNWVNRYIRDLYGFDSVSIIYK